MKAILLALGLSFVAGIVVLACGALTVRSRATFKLVGIAGGTLIGVPCLLVAGTVVGIFVNVGGGNPQAVGFVFFLLVATAAPLLAYAGIARRRLEKLGAAEEPDPAMEGTGAIATKASRHCHQTPAGLDAVPIVRQ